MLNVRRYWAALVVAATLGAGIIIGSLATHGVRAAKVAVFAPGAKPLADPSPVELSNSFAKVAMTVSPAVVNIRTESTVRLADRHFRAPGGEPGDDFFNRFFHMGPGGPPSDFQQQSLGSGIILDQNGYILTNYHVVMQDGGDKPVDRMRVQLASDQNDLTMYPAKLVGSDKWTDLAVIKIETGKPLPVAQLGDSHSMRVGDWVLAIGSPFGLQTSVTAGIISAKGRDNIESGRSGEFKRFIQTDAAINPGNSGGPLVSMAAQVIGVNTAIATTRGSYDGVGFAIPSNVARKVYNSIITSGAVRRGAIGVTFMNLRNDALLRSFGASHGVVVESVEPGSPAEKAGLERGDVITALDGQPVSGGDELLSIISNTEPGKKLVVEYLRDRKTEKATIIVGDWNRIVGEDISGAREGGNGSPQAAAAGILGFNVKALGPDEAKDLATQLRLPHPQGVLVTDVMPGGFAEDLGVERLDIVLSINHKEVTSVDQFNHLQSELKSGQDVLLLVARRQGRGYTTLFLADPLP
jgi:serine protease Do